MNIENKQVLKEVAILVYVVAGMDKYMSAEEELISDNVIKDIFNFSNGEVLDIKESIYKNKNLLQKVLNALDIIKKENNKTLNIIILALLSTLTSADGEQSKNELKVIGIIKEKLSL